MYITLPHLKKQEKIKLFIISFFLHTRFLSLVLDECRGWRPAGGFWSLLFRQEKKLKNDFLNMFYNIDTTFPEQMRNLKA